MAIGDLDYDPPEMNDKGKFPVRLHCNRCGQNARYEFDVKESQLEYIRLWNAWHDIPGHGKHVIEPEIKESK